VAPPFHPGELAVQRRAGVADMAEKVGLGIRPEIGPAVARFVAGQRFAVLGALDASGAPWASLVSGPRGFLAARDARTLGIAARPPAGDPLAGALVPGAAVGLVVLDPTSRRRVRLNGTVVEADAGTLALRTAQVYGNCPKYIQRRTPLADAADEPPLVVASGPRLMPRQRDAIARADTFFVASAHPTAGVDASHRGGRAGFVLAADDATLVWPDYVGNAMFQTLGNLHVRPAAGLLFVDFATGTTLQVTGTATIVWDRACIAAHAGAERLVELRVASVVETASATPLRWRLEAPSPFNP
jgi:predicted pyridoxine 5'-phosphate oxidase superfamily flavin-nucleotide-binding protein